MRKWQALALVVVVWLALPVLPAAAAGHAVQMKQYAFGPGALTVSVGDSVTWTNYDTAQHDVMITSGPLSFHGPLIGKGQSWTYTFGTPGTYSYICSIHPDMKAQLVVKPKAQAVAPAQHSQPATGAAAPSATARPSASASPTAMPAVPAASPTPQMQMPAATDAAATSGLNPLLLVAGISVAVVVFCLLLMTSRPVPAPAAPMPPLNTVPPPSPEPPASSSPTPAHRSPELEDTAVLPDPVDPA